MNNLELLKGYTARQEWEYMNTSDVVYQEFKVAECAGANTCIEIQDAEIIKSQIQDLESWPNKKCITRMGFLTGLKTGLEYLTRG